MSRIWFYLRSHWLFWKDAAKSWLRSLLILYDIFLIQKQERELIQIISTLSSVESLNIKLAMMYLIEIICEYSFDDKLLMEYSGGFEAIFQKGLEDESIQVKVSAFKTLTVFLSSITKL